MMGTQSNAERRFNFQSRQMVKVYDKFTGEHIGYAPREIVKRYERKE